MRRKSRKRAFTLIEVLIGIALLAGVGIGLLLSMNRSMMHADFLSEMQVAMNAVEGMSQQLAATPVDTLWTSGVAGGIDYPTARTGVWISNLAGLPSGLMAVQIRNADLRNPGTPAIIDIHVAACWVSRNQRTIGEGNGTCTETDGGVYAPDPATVPGGPGIDSGWEVSSITQITTRVTR